MNNLFWLTDEQWQTIKSFLPTRHTGPRRVDDRRLISGIVSVLRSGCRWRDCPREYGPHTTIYNRFNRWSSRELCQTIFAALVSVGEAPRLLMADSSAAKAHLSASGGRMGEIRQAVGRSRGGRTTKVHALTDEQGRPHAFLLTGGQVADIKGAASLLTSMPPSQKFVGDKAYDADHLRGWLRSRGTVRIIPNLSSVRNAFIISSNRTGGPLGFKRRLGAASTAQASDAQDARMARFSLSVRSGSLTTSDGCPNARAGCKSCRR